MSFITSSITIPFKQTTFATDSYINVGAVIDTITGVADLAETSNSIYSYLNNYSKEICTAGETYTTSTSVFSLACVMLLYHPIRASGLYDVRIFAEADQTFVFRVTTSSGSNTSATQPAGTQWSSAISIAIDSTFNFLTNPDLLFIEIKSVSAIDDFVLYTVSVTPAGEDVTSADFDYGTFEPIDQAVMLENFALSVRDMRALVQNNNFLFKNFLRGGIINYYDFWSPTTSPTNSHLSTTELSTAAGRLLNEWIYFPHPGARSIRVHLSGWTAGWTAGDVGARMQIGFKNGAKATFYLNSASPTSVSAAGDMHIADLDIPAGGGPHIITLVGAHDPGTINNGYIWLIDAQEVRVA